MGVANPIFRGNYRPYSRAAENTLDSDSRSNVTKAFTTETQRTQRMRRELKDIQASAQSLCTLCLGGELVFKSHSTAIDDSRWMNVGY